MDRLHVQGTGPLQGTLENAGAKNACLSILSASLLSKETLRLTNLPVLSDVETMIGILNGLGTEIERTGDVAECRTERIPDPTSVIVFESRSIVARTFGFSAGSNPTSETQ